MPIRRTVVFGSLFHFPILEVTEKKRSATDKTEKLHQLNVKKKKHFALHSALMGKTPCNPLKSAVCLLWFCIYI